MGLDARHLSLAVLLVIAGCSGGTTVDQGTTRAPVAPASTVRVPLLAPGGPHHQVAAAGTLEVEGPCLYLRAPNGTRTLPVFATANTRWNAAEGWLEVGDRKFRPGETVRLGGSPAQPLPPSLPWLQAPDPSCERSAGFIAYEISPGQ